MTKRTGTRSHAAASFVVLIQASVLKRSVTTPENMAALTPSRSDMLMEQGLRVNVVGPVLATQAALSALLDGGGMIVNVSSGVSLIPNAVMGVYTSSKAAMNLISASLREELRDKGIHVMTVHPGWIDNEFRTNSLYSNDAPKPNEMGRPSIGNRRTSAEAARDIVEAMRNDQEVLLCGPQRSTEVPL